MPSLSESRSRKSGTPSQSLSTGGVPASASPASRQSKRPSPSESVSIQSGTPSPSVSGAPPGASRPSSMSAMVSPSASVTSRTGMHRPVRHTESDAHTTSQLPQWATFVSVSTHKPPQLVVPLGHSSAHDPVAHTSSSGQATPHNPQLPGSTAVSTHAPAHRTSGAGHVSTQLPSRQKPVAPQGAKQSPQCEGLERKSAHSSPHTMSGHPGEHDPSTQNSPSAHGRPHVPQFAKLERVSTHSPSQRLSVPGHGGPASERPASRPPSTPAPPSSPLNGASGLRPPQAVTRRTRGRAEVSRQRTRMGDERSRRASSTREGALGNAASARTRTKGRRRNRKRGDPAMPGRPVFGMVTCALWDPPFTTGPEPVFHGSAPCGYECTSQPPCSPLCGLFASKCRAFDLVRLFVVDVSDQFALAARAARDGAFGPSSASIDRAVMHLRFQAPRKAPRSCRHPLVAPAVGGRLEKPLSLPPDL